MTCYQLDARNILCPLPVIRCQAKYLDGSTQTLQVAPLKTEEIPVGWYL